MNVKRIESLLRKSIVLMTCVCLLIYVTSCGTILYPERRGQQTDLSQIDVKVVVFDGLLVFLFVLPGVIAYAVDFSTGCIYLPPGQIMQNPNIPAPSELQVIHIDPAELDAETIAQVVETHTGHTISINDPEMRVFRPAHGILDLQVELQRLAQGLEPLSEGTWLPSPMLSSVSP